MRLSQAIVTLVNLERSINIGDITFTQISPDSNVTVTGTLKGLNKNVLRGMHIQCVGISFHSAPAYSSRNSFISQSANFSLGCNSTGTHFNPTNVTHGDRTDLIRHVGDLGNIQTDVNGTSTFNFTVNMISLFVNSTNSFIG